ncbi:MAG: tetratricopeptide repeat protein [Candidatus Aminicenantaceae bacterium]
MVIISEKALSEQVKECRKKFTHEEKIGCFEKLLKETKSGHVAYALGYEYEKAGELSKAIKYYEKAESMFNETIYKNMSRFAINNIVVDVLKTDKSGKKE